MAVTPLSFVGLEPDPQLVDPIVTTAEAARLLGKCRATLIRWVDEGRAHPLRKLDGTHGSYLFALSEIERLRATPRPRKPRGGAGQ